MKTQRMLRTRGSDLEIYVESMTGWEACLRSRGGEGLWRKRRRGLLKRRVAQKPTEWIHGPLSSRENATPPPLPLSRSALEKNKERERRIYIYISLSAVNNCSSRPSRFVEVEISRVDPWETTMEIPWICCPSKIKGLFRRVKVRGSEEILL